MILLVNKNVWDITAEKTFSRTLYFYYVNTFGAQLTQNAFKEL